MKYDFGKIEKKWQKEWLKEWLKEGTYEPSFAKATVARRQSLRRRSAGKPDLKKAKNPFYNLMMFPYPSAEGLHVGNMYAFTGSDIYGRMKRMQGNDVFEPIGLDGFGIHSENYALKIGAHPMEQAKVSEKRFYQQLQTIGNGFAWSEKLETYSPDYYKWTQWIFLQLWKKGLAYRKKQPVNWCPSCKTVLADEQVVDGKCERCSSVVEKKNLEQWFFKITDYAERLLGNLDKLDWSEKVQIAQRNWIGRSEGVNIHSRVKDLNIKFEVFDSVPQTFMAQTFTVIAPEHPMVVELVKGTKFEKPVLEAVEAMKKKKANGAYKAEADFDGIFTGRYVDNPFGTGDLPIWVASFVVMEYGTGIVHCSAHDERDFVFAKKFDIPLRPVMFPKDKTLAERVRNLEFAYCKDPDGIMEQPKEFAGRKWGEVRNDVIAFMEKRGIAKRTVYFRLRDWLISRQRYWGAPIPMIHCDACAKEGKGEQKEMPGWYAVPEKDLPVELPYVKDFRPQGKGESPLASVEPFYKTKCPGCKGQARRETDVSDTFLDSAWYFLRYPSATDAKRPWDPSLTKKWLPVNMYIGGAEHSVLHLLYSRFVTMALHDMQLLHFEEPFTKFRAHGLLIKEGAKMSKSKGNVVNPDEYVKKFGADTLRMYLMFLAPFEQGGDFRDASILGVERFLKRVWKLFSDKRQATSDKEQKELEQLIHRTVKKVTGDIENLHYNTAISALMVLLNKMEGVRPSLSRVACSMFLKMLAPFAPFMTEEIWREVLGNKTSIHLAEWPDYDEKFIAADTFTLVIQIDGRVRDIVEGVAVSISEEEARALALSREKVEVFIGGKSPQRVVYIRGRIVNIVL
ncbi:MAG: leucine--tRNA ligase [Candidatus Liptonbacteria bacterium]|nr:leucine--tRNA ligase [Candidatus Liptonbacteria bacterium]